MQIIVWLSSSSPNLDMSPPQWFFKHHPVSFSWGTQQNIFTISLNSATGQKQANEDLCVYIQDWQPDWPLDAYLWGGEEKDGGASQWRKKLCVFPEWSTLWRCLLPTYLPQRICFYHLCLSRLTTNITNLPSNLHCTSVLILCLIFKNRVWLLSIFLSLKRQNHTLYIRSESQISICPHVLSEMYKFIKTQQANEIFHWDVSGI